MTSKPSGTVTFLFADIENSIQLARENPQSRETMRARRHAILHEAMEGNHRFVFQIAGNPFCTAFHKAAHGI